MSSSEPKSEPLFAEPIDDVGVAPDGYDPDLKRTVVNPSGPSPAKQTLLYGNNQLAPRAAVLPEAAQSPSFDGASTLLSSPPGAAGGEVPLSFEEGKATFVDGSASAEQAFAETELPTNAAGQVEVPEQAKRTTILPRAVLKGAAPSLHLVPRERYEPIQDLGEGAAGDVALARDNDINRLVALKKLKKKHHVPTTLARFVEEIQTVGQLEHPNIVPIHDVGVDENGLYYFVMKYVEGETMADIIERLRAGDEETHEAYSFTVRTQIFLKVLQAVQFAHQHGIIHRDLKPENIMVGDCGQVMVMDWGIAKRIAAPTCPSDGSQIVPEGKEAMSGAIAAMTQRAALPTGTHKAASQHLPDRERLFETQLGTIMGTPAYMPPEQALGKVDLIDVRSDLYSLAAVYYEWMTLKHYLGHKTNLQDLLWGILQEQPVFPAFVSNEHQDNVPAEISHFIAKGLHKEPAERYQSIQEMEHTLQLAMAGRFGVQCPITLMKRGGTETLRFIDRHPVLSMAGAIFGVILAIVGTAQVGMWLYSALT